MSKTPEKELTEDQLEEQIESNIVVLNDLTQRASLDAQIKESR